MNEVHNIKGKKGLSPKLQTSWNGFYKIIKRLNDVVYRIQRANSPRAKMKVVHREQLPKYWCGDNEPIRS